MKNNKITSVLFLVGTFCAAGGIKAQTVGDWLDGTGAPSGAKSYTLTGALGVGTPLPKAWAEVVYCPYLTPSIGLAVSATDFCQVSGGGIGGGGIGGGDGFVDPNGTMPPFEMPGTISNVPLNFTPNTGYHTLNNNPYGPLIIARLQSPGTQFGSTNIMGQETPRFLVTSLGKTGINTANPRAYLDVIGDHTLTNEPVAMFGVKAQIKGDVPSGPIMLRDYYTRHVALYSKVSAGFGSSLTTTNDQVLLFTDGKQPNGLNLKAAW